MKKLIASPVVLILFITLVWFGAIHIAFAGDYIHSVDEYLERCRDVDFSPRPPVCDFYWIVEVPVNCRTDFSPSPGQRCDIVVVLCRAVDFSPVHEACVDGE